MNIRLALITLTAFTLSGCLGLTTPKLPPSQAAKYDTIHELVDGSIKRHNRTFFNLINMNQPARPYNLSRDYCHYHNGEFVQVAEAEPIEWFWFGVGGYNEREAGRQKLNSMLGLFECRQDNEVMWAINFHHEGVGTTEMNSTELRIWTTPYSKPEYDVFLAKRQKEIEAKIMNILDIENDFRNAVNTPKFVGQKVCTRDNLFGFIESISGEKIKVLVSGKASGQPENFFFSGSGRFLKHDINRITWDDAKNWGACDFSDNL
jgi:hypothetical protein